MTAPTDELQTTPLHDRHLALSARMGEFAGYDMPINYGSIANEHRAVRENAGAFDVSHMGRLRFFGRDGHDALQRLATVHVDALETGRARYGFILNADGGVVDDVIVYRLDKDEWLVVVNGANRTAVVRHLGELGISASAYTDETDTTGMIALQGPSAREVLGKMNVGISVPEYSMRIVRHKQLQLTTTGYTGEDGVEVVAPADAAGALWDQMLDAGAAPAGLGARDTLRLEMGYPLHGHELTPEHTPWGAGLDWGIDLRNEGFHGRERLLGLNKEGFAILTGLKCTGRGTPRAGYVVSDGEDVVGRVTSGGFSPMLETGIALAFVNPDLREPGVKLTVAADETGRRALPVEVVRLPFYRDGSRRPSGGSRRDAS